MKKLFTLALAFLTIGLTSIAFADSPKKEGYYNDLFCEEVGGEREVRLPYRWGEGEKQSGDVIADCKTKTHVYEGGKDTRGSLDSVQQALFFSYVSKLKPAVVIYDTDGKFGQYEYQIKKASEEAGVEFIHWSVPP